MQKILDNASLYYVGLRYAITVIGSVAATLGFASGSIDAQSVLSGLNDIAEGVKLIMRGGGIILAVLMPIWGLVRSTLKSKAGDVQVAAPAVLANAVAQIKPNEMIAAVNELPVVKAVLTTPDVPGRATAAAIPSSTVVPAGTIQAKDLAMGNTQ
jgi:hypothetical protein